MGANRVGTRFSESARAIAREQLARNRTRSAQGKGPLAVWVKKSNRRNKRTKH